MRMKTCLMVLTGGALALVAVADNSFRECTWTGSGDGVQWNDAANWSDQTLPKDGDTVIFSDVAAAQTVLLTNSTPALAALTLGAKTTLMVSNWTSKVEAEAVTIRSGGVLTCGDAFNEGEMSNRVWIVCRTLDVQSGGSIDVDMRGYRLNNGPGAWYNSSTKGKSNGGGGAHGGYGGVNACYGRPLPYDSVSEPVCAGSGGVKGPHGYHGGSSSEALSAFCGGGVVRIEASESVCVNGSIRAGGKPKYSVGGTYAGAGAGGSVWISTQRFLGNGGVLSACGCPANYMILNGSTGQQGMAGGGGRIAIHYNADVQQSGDAVNMTLDASCGRARLGTVSFRDYDDNDYAADIGTLWFTDEKLLESLGRSMWGEIHLGSDPATLSFDSFSLTAGYLRFGHPGLTFEVTGDMTISGNEARLDLGGDEQRLDLDRIFHYTTAPVTLMVGGNLTVGGNGRLDVSPAATNGAAWTQGALVSVGGTLTVAAEGRVQPWCHPTDGASVQFDVGALTVAESGLLTADNCGFWGGFVKPTDHKVGWGPGRADFINVGGVSMRIGAGHGGYGGNGGEEILTAGHIYDDVNVPALPGSGGYNQGWSSQSQGGGTVLVKACGAISIDGTVSAAATHVPDEGRCAAGSGGSILLEGKTFSAGATAVLNVKGSDGTTEKTPKYGCSAGGGGRIAIWTGKPRDGKTKIRHCVVSETPQSDKGQSSLGTVNLAGGTTPSFPDLAGGAGTIRYVYNPGQPGIVILFR